MANLLDKYNKNKFSVYDSEEKTVLKIIENINDFNKEVAVEVENKTDKNGDHKGSWQGLNKPTLSEEGMRATVEKINEIDLPHIDNRVVKQETHTSGWINVKDFGAKGDGITDDTNAINDCFNSLGVRNEYTWKQNNSMVVIFPPGTYLISSPIIIRNNCLVQGNNAEIKATISMDSCIKFDTTFSLAYFTIFDLIINGNGLANVGLDTRGCLGKYYRMNVHSCIEACFKSTKSEIGGSIKLYQCRAFGHISDSGDLSMWSPTENSSGLIATTTDTVVEGCGFINFKKHIVLKGYPAYINNCHNWNYPNYYKDSTFLSLEENGGFVHINGSECDTLQNFVKFNITHCNVLLSQCHWFMYSGIQNAENLVIFNYNGNYANNIVCDSLGVETNGYTVAVDNTTGEIGKYTNCLSDNLALCGRNRGFNSSGHRFSELASLTPSLPYKYSRVNGESTFIAFYFYFQTPIAATTDDYHLGEISGYTRAQDFVYPALVQLEDSSFIWGTCVVKKDGKVYLKKMTGSVRSIKVNTVIPNILNEE